MELQKQKILWTMPGKNIALEKMMGAVLLIVICPVLYLEWIIKMLRGDGDRPGSGRRPVLYLEWIIKMLPLLKMLLLLKSSTDYPREPHHLELLITQFRFLVLVHRLRNLPLSTHKYLLKAVEQIILRRMPGRRMVLERMTVGMVLLIMICSVLCLEWIIKMLPLLKMLLLLMSTHKFLLKVVEVVLILKGQAQDGSQ